MNGKQEYGDYQTPYEFATRVCEFLKTQKDICPDIVLEPTCGIGNFLKGSLIFNAKKYYGIEISPEYCDICTHDIPDKRVQIIQSNIFNYDLKHLTGTRNVLVIGNPPWVTNSALSAIGSDNLPTKVNFKGLKGLDAITGAGNFDICEYIILQLVAAYTGSDTTIAMLCKTSVARNVFKELKRTHTYFKACDLYEFDAQKVFGINASACLLLISLSSHEVSSDKCDVYSFDTPLQKTSSFGFINGQFYSDLGYANDNFDGSCCFEWRQGVKHDCSKVMELTFRNGKLQNGQKETVEIEDDIVFPLIKSSMFKAPIIHSFSKYVIVTQKKAREETAHLQMEVPKTWDYLNRNIDFFNNRKSSIYRGAPAFSMFGVGDYSYSRYKVGVSGFYKRPLFSVLYSDDGKPVMTDDTSYFICFDNYNMAYVAMLLLNSDKVQGFLTSIAFLDAKRPYTKKVLERIDFDKIVNVLCVEDLTRTEQQLDLPRFVTLSMYDDFKELLEAGPQLLFV